MDKKTLFYAGKGSRLTFEILADQAEGKLTQKFEDLVSKVDRTTNAKSSYMGGIVDLGFLGVMVGKSSYEYRFFLESGAPPDYWARDNDWEINYGVMKLGTAFRVGSFTLGLFYLEQQSDGTVDFTFFDPDTGNQGSTLPYDITTDTKGYGVGVGYSTSTMHFEVSQERVTSQKLSTASDFPWDVEAQPLSERFTIIGEVKLKWFALGLRYRLITGNFYDLEDVISAKLLYEDLAKTDTRSETTFNFSLGGGKGITYSGFYSSSDVASREEVEIVGNGFLYPTTTKSQAYGINISYIF